MNAKKEKNKNLFLESIFLGLPIPFMFLADCSDGRQEIIDGAQRMDIGDNLTNVLFFEQVSINVVKGPGYEPRLISESFAFIPVVFT